MLADGTHNAALSLGAERSEVDSVAVIVMVNAAHGRVQIAHRLGKRVRSLIRRNILLMALGGYEGLLKRKLGRHGVRRGKEERLPVLCVGGALAKEAVLRLLNGAPSGQAPKNAFNVGEYKSL